MLVDGSVTIRAGSYKYIEWQLFHDDGVTPFDLTLMTKVTLRLKHAATGAVTEYATDDVSPQFFVTDDEGGQIQLRPEGDFDAVAEYVFHFVIEDGNGDPHHVPEDHDEVFRVIDGYAP